MRDGLKRELDARFFFSFFFPRTNVARFDIILAENCFSQFYETRKLRSFELLERWNISGGERRIDRENGISPLDSAKVKRRRKGSRYFRSPRFSRVSFLGRISHFRAPRLSIGRSEEIVTGY